MGGVGEGPAGMRGQGLSRGARGSIRGFTLIEVLIALALMSVVLLPAMSAVATLARSETRSETRTHAVELARSAIEAMKSLDAASFEAGSVLTTVSGPGGRGSYDVERVLTVSDEDDFGNRLWEVSVSVYSHPRDEDAQALCTLATLIYGG